MGGISAPSPCHPVIHTPLDTANTLPAAGSRTASGDTGRGATAVNVSRRGFTLIEILVTIGIILVLVSIVAVGITYVTKAGKNNSAKVSLNNMRGMIAELEMAAGL